MNETAEQLAAACQSGDRRAASRLISLIESGDPAVVAQASRAVKHFPAPQQTIGITGPPGAGKSTLVQYLTLLYRERGEKVGVLAVDPSSPFTGGALLGDRIRMSRVRNDSGVFVRSMGSRGASGGIASAAGDALRILAAAGFQRVILETVGAGQAETEIIDLADTVIVVQVPGLGDDVQLMKMGILETADVFVVNKGDKPEAEGLKLQIEMALHENIDPPCRALRQLGKKFRQNFQGTVWEPPVLLVSALNSTGGEAVLDACARHEQFLQQPQLKEALLRSRIVREILWRSAQDFQRQLADKLEPGGALARLVDAARDGKQSLDAVVKQIVQNS